MSNIFKAKVAKCYQWLNYLEELYNDKIFDDRNVLES